MVFLIFWYVYRRVPHDSRQPSYFLAEGAHRIAPLHGQGSEHWTIAKGYGYGFDVQKAAGRCISKLPTERYIKTILTDFAVLLAFSFVSEVAGLELESFGRSLSGIGTPSCSRPQHVASCEPIIGFWQFNSLLLKMVLLSLIYLW